MHDFEDIMIKLDDIEAKVDTLIARKQEEEKEFEPEYTYEYYSSYSNDIGGEKRSAEVCKRGDGVWCVEKLIDGELMELLPLPGKSESFAEHAAENFVLLA
jgi:hypothetical protein